MAMAGRHFDIYILNYIMWQNIKNFITKLQNSDEAIKKRWLIGASAVAMILIISLWLVYLNYTLGKTGAVENESDNSTSFWQVFKTGLVIVGNSIKDKAGDLIYVLKDKIGSRNTIIIERER